MSSANFKLARFLGCGGAVIILFSACFKIPTVQ